MTTDVVSGPVTRRRFGRRVAVALHSRPRLRLAGLLALPATWLVVVYLTALFALLGTAFLSVDEFTNAVVLRFTASNVVGVLTSGVYLQAAARTIAVAAAVTALCALLAVPMSLFMAKVARPRARGVLVALVLTPLWASYLVKVYAWQAMTQPRTGVLDWALGGHGPGYGTVAVVLTLTYLWLPYMVLPVFAGLERLPDSLVDASADLGARPGRTLRTVVLPLLYPSIVAGSVFTFSLSLGDYITVQVVGGTTQLLGNIVFQNYAANLPFAAAIALIPVLVVMVYLTLVRRTGALDNL